MGLSEKESKMLADLLKKKDEPDAPAVGKSINVSIDLGDPKQVELAQRHGFLGMLTDDDDTDDETDDDDTEETPRRRAFFDDKK